jgi:serine/threonine-protein kinase
VFLAGIVLWELLTDHVLFTGTSDADLRSAVSDATVPRPSTLVDGLPAAIDEVVMKALAKDRDQRFPTAKAFASALQIAGGSSIAAPSSVGRFVRDVGPQIPERPGARPPPKRGQSAVHMVVLLGPTRGTGRKFTGSAFVDGRADEPQTVAPPETKSAEARSDLAAQTKAPARAPEAELDAPPARAAAVSAAPRAPPKRGPIFGGAAAAPSSAPDAVDAVSGAIATAGAASAAEPTAHPPAGADVVAPPLDLAPASPAGSSSEEASATASLAATGAAPVVADAVVAEIAVGEGGEPPVDSGAHADTHTALAISTFASGASTGARIDDGDDALAIGAARRSRVQRIAFAALGAAAAVGLLAWGVSALGSDPPPAASPSTTATPSGAKTAARATSPGPELAPPDSAPPPGAVASNAPVTAASETADAAPSAPEPPPTANVATTPFQRPIGTWPPKKRPASPSKKKPPKYIP